jgi:hypothetical protein
MNCRVMYIELKADGVRGPARIGRVEFSKTGKTLYYSGRKLAPLNGRGFKANYFDSETLEEFWISGPKANGTDSLYWCHYCDRRGLPEGVLARYPQEAGARVERFVSITRKVEGGARLAREGGTSAEHGWSLAARAI